MFHIIIFSDITTAHIRTITFSMRLSSHYQHFDRTMQPNIIYSVNALPGKSLNIVFVRLRNIVENCCNYAKMNSYSLFKL